MDDLMDVLSAYNLSLTKISRHKERNKLNHMLFCCVSLKKTMSKLLKVINMRRQTLNIYISCM